MANRPSPLLPVDSRIPRADELADVGTICRLIGEPSGARIRLRYVEHDPGRSIVVKVAVDDRLYAVSIGRVSPVGDGPVVTRYPDDLGLPGLRDGWHALASRLGLDGVAPQRLAWVPHTRLVVAVGDQVVKLHASGTETERSVACSRLVGEVVPVPGIEMVDTGRAVHVQQRIAGRPLEGRDALSAVPSAAGVVRALGGLDPARLVRHAPDDLLALCAPVVRLVEHAAPDLGDRCAALLVRLERSRPEVAMRVPCHGDFNVGQLLATDDGLVLVDTDTLCAGSAAFDPASYAANLVSGRQHDMQRASEVADRFAEEVSFGRSELDWFLGAMLVRRLDRAIRRGKRDWRERTQRLVDAADDVTARLGAWE